MRKEMDKALVALACALLIGALGALSWHGDQELAIPAGEVADDSGNAGACDEVIYEIEKFHSIWRSHDARTSGRKGEAGNP